MSCYAARSLALPHIRRATLHVLLHFLPHIRHATLLHVLLHFHTYVIVMLCCSMFSWTSTHTSCYEPEQLAMLMVAKLGKGPRDNKCQKNASNGKTLPTTAVSLWSTWAESPRKKSSSLAGTQTLLTDSGAKKWKYLYAAVWRKSVKGNVLNNLLCLKGKKELFGETLDPSTNKTPVSCL